MKVAIQGVAGSFHEQAAHTFLAPAPYEIVSCNTFSEVFRAVKSGAVEYGVSALENNLHGSINEVYRLLERHDLWIVAEYRMRIQQQLIGSSMISVDELAKQDDRVRVLSQAPALAQVEQWLDAHLPDAIRQETHDTADSVRQIMAQNNPYTLAIAGTQAADLYGAVVVSENINDDPDNFTRFVLMQKAHEPVADATASSLILRTDHSPGALERALRVFGEANINLTKLDSHPIAGDKQHYAFYIDVDSPSESEVMQLALATVEQQGCKVRILGSYKRLE